MELSIEEADTTRLLNQLASEHLDAAFVRPGMNSSKTVLVQTLLEEPMVILLPERHPLAKFRQLPLAALANEKLVLFPRQAGVEWFDEIIASCRQSGFEPILGLEAPQITSVSNLVAAGLGVSLVPLSVASQIQKTGTCSVKIKGKSPVARLSLAVRADHSSVVLKNFEALVRSLKK